MIDKIVEHVTSHLEKLPQCLERCRHILLSWGFAHSVFRTAENVLGGVAARATDMTKGQAGFSDDLRGRNVGDLFRAAFEKQLRWSRPVTVANDGIMALHHFLTGENTTTHAQCGLFINGTGTNFALAEPFAVRGRGVVSAPGEEYQPERLTRHRTLRPGEKVERYLVNYETGSIDLVATRTRYDVPSDYPIEYNALAGGNAFEQQFREIVRARLGPELHTRLVERGKLLESWRRQERGQRFPRGPEISRLAGEGVAALEEIFPGAGLDAVTAEKIVLVCRAVVSRSALHAALILAAVTRHIGFGLGGTMNGAAGGGDGAAGGEDGARPDLLATEGSVWSTPRYRMLVHGYWRDLVGAGRLAVDFDHERNYDASLAGPLYLAVLQA
jgi:hypothetical protein